MKKLYTPQEAVRIIEKNSGKPITDRQVRHEIQIGHLKAEKIGGTWLIQEKDLFKYKRRSPGPVNKKRK